MSTSPESMSHAARCAVVQRWLQQSAAGRPLGLSKATSNLFRDRAASRKTRLDLQDFHHVIALDEGQGWVDVEGCATYEELVREILPLGWMPAVVPQLKTITVGGAAAGVGIEATSFAQGLVHDTVLEIEVLLADGGIVLCRPDNEHRALYFGFPNSYGTLGYALRLRLRVRPVLPFVKVRHERFGSAAAFFDALVRHCDDAAKVDFIDGVVFGADSLVLNLGQFIVQAPSLSDYGGESIYYKSLLERDVDWMRTEDYLWRWDTDWFWCSRRFCAQRLWVRRLLGRKRLNSRTYARLMRLNSRWGLTRGWARLRGWHPESVIQDVDIPVARAEPFLDFLLREVGILPIWICPVREPAGSGPFDLYPLSPVLHVNFGFWDTVQSRVAHEAGHLNRRIEREVARLGGIKSLYSDSFYTRDEFAAAYGMDDYAALKARYDPMGRLPGLYEKCVLRA
ncbi:MAG: FAD-binding oxidoreductase [Burkholderiales bacterium]|nr:FAD-binding oxidoreductase [Burkholderiales bacterium]